MARLLALTVLLGLLVACLPVGTGAPTTGVAATQTPATPAPSTASPIPPLLATTVAITAIPASATPSKDRTSGPVLIVQRSGGFAGVMEKWMIYPDGRITAPNGRQQQVESGQVTALLTQIASSGLFALNSSHTKLTKCRDCFIYQITLMQEGKAQTVQVQPESSEIPEEPLKAIRSINDFLSTLPKG